MLLVGQQEGHSACKTRKLCYNSKTVLRTVVHRAVETEWWDFSVVICLGSGADLYMAQQMPMPLYLLLQ